MNKLQEFEIVLVSSGHQALDHRVFDKEAVSLAKHFARVRVVAAHPSDEVRHAVIISALRPFRSRMDRFLWQPLRGFWRARGPGKRLLILHDAELLPWAPLVRLVTGWQIIYDVHEDFSQLLMHRTWIPTAIRRSISRAVGSMEKLFSRSCDGIIGVTDVLTDYFVHAQRTAIYNLPSREFLAEAANLARPLDEREYDVVHLGTLSDERMEYLCTVLDHLFSRKAEARVLIIGVRPDQEERLQARYAPERVTVIGKVPYREIAGHLGNCLVGINVHPVLHAHLRCAIPVKVFEYMASGCNVVTSYLPELHRVLGEEGAALVTTMYTPAPDRYADEIVRLLDDPAVMARRQEELLTMVGNRWNWDHEAEKLVQFVSQILQRKELIQHEQVPDHQC